MIPKKIHCCWFGQNPKPEHLEKYIQTWSQIMPDYEIYEWNEQNFPLDSLYLKTAYERQWWSKMTNFARFCVLYHHGGLYFDTDVEVLKPFDPLLSHSCFLGFQQAQAGDDWINSAITGAEAGHPFLRNCMDETLRHFLHTGQYYRGPQLATKLLVEAGLTTYGQQTLSNQVTLFPTEYFYPYPWDAQFDPATVTEETYCIHHWQISWRDGEQQFLQMQQQKAIPPYIPATIYPRSTAGSLSLRINHVIVNEQDVTKVSFNSGDNLAIQFCVEAPIEPPIDRSIVQIKIEDATGQTYIERTTSFAISGQNVIPITCNISRLDLPTGIYYLTIGLYEANWAYSYDFWWRTVEINVSTDIQTEGLIAPPIDWEIATL